jgi:alcohol dehydrogenase class IV
MASFGDATYTMTLSPEFTRSTALDALSHCLESYFNRTANDISRTFALRGIVILTKMLKRTSVADYEPLSFEDREALYCASLYGGLAISVTGTVFPHALGYFLSEQYGISHGNACAVYA